LGAGILVGLIVFINQAVRKVSIQYAKRIRGGKVYGGQQTHLPIKVNVAGVMPIIFAVSIMLVPSFVGRIMTTSANPALIAWGQRLTIWFQQTSPVYLITYFLMVFGFTFFSALIFFNAEDIAEELKKSGAFVPGIRPGGATKKFLEYVVVRITLVGAIFLSLLAILPSLAQIATGIDSLAIGGTSILIVVSVILETSKQVESMIVGQDYDKYQ
jgi:preprotein translocase subunit SecY